ncbi:hypothetical protein HYX11_04810 [Candidatus Woesearchaeota archaeon]|nr:hypothetical protein [Candidatus Woesearchaeota archaeon]
MHNKGAIELSINTLVIIIISIVILSAGITLLYKFIGGAEEIKTKLDTQTNAELERLLVDQGKQVSLPLHVADVPRGENHVFGLGILNIGGQLNGKNIGEEFTMRAEFIKLVDLQNKNITGKVIKEEINQWLLYDSEPQIMRENEHTKLSILVNVPTSALTGQYIFDAKVILNDGRQYGNTQKFYVNVK